MYYAHLPVGVLWQVSLRRRGRITWRDPGRTQEAALQSGLLHNQVGDVGKRDDSDDGHNLQRGRDGPATQACRANRVAVGPRPPFALGSPAALLGLRGEQGHQPLGHLATNGRRKRQGAEG